MQSVATAIAVNLNMARLNNLVQVSGFSSHFSICIYNTYTYSYTPYTYILIYSYTHILIHYPLYTTLQVPADSDRVTLLNEMVS
jgi:hypothetical protein